ncbi:MAG: succinate dehydrogenase, cytochrome b556 subunit [Chloroflexi bacterium]|nr:succinate dehydrogenase, cytochrome b556 subunit [Chloroflexota bacterium]
MAFLRAEKRTVPAPGWEWWLWLLHRVTGLLLVLALAAHIIILHLAQPGEGIAFDRVVARLASPPFLALDTVLLAAALFHGLNGIRVVAADMGMGRRSLRALSWWLFALGLVGFIYGVYALLSFL